MRSSRLLPRFISVIAALFVCIRITPARLASIEAIPVSSEREITLSRWAVGFSGLYFREYDLPGGRALFLKGTSLAGYPDLVSPQLGWYNPIHTLALGSSGLSADSLLWDPWSVRLGAVNGTLYEQENTPALNDTPRVYLHWQRGAFSANNFRLYFTRSLLDSLTLDLALHSESTDSSGMYRYADITHQPYLGTLKRDSAAIPFQGRNLRIDNFGLYPRITRFYPWGYASVQWTMLRQHGEDASRHAPETDPISSYDVFVVPPYRLNIRNDGLGIAFHTYPTRLWSIDLWYQRSVIHQGYDRVPRLRAIPGPTRDTLSPAQWTESGIAHAGEMLFRLRDYPFYARSEYETRRWTSWLSSAFEPVAGKVAWQDRETWIIGGDDSILSPDLNVRLSCDGGIHRYGDNQDRSFFNPVISGHASLFVKQRLGLQSSYAHHPVWPSLEQTQFANTARLSFPNAELHAERHHRGEMRVLYQTAFFEYGLAWRGELIQNAIRYGWLLHPYANTLPDSVAFRYQNIPEMQAQAWIAWSRFRIGKWSFFLERESRLYAKIAGDIANTDVPARLYKGSLLWQTRAVGERLYISTRWDFQWIGERNDFASVNPSVKDTVVPRMAYRTELPKYLSLHFESRMRIKSFALYSRIENLNHSKIRPETGYTPPGISFRYGIEWTLDH